MGSGSLFVANGGTYKLRVSPMMGANWHIRVTSVGPAGSSFAAGNPGIYVPPDMTSVQEAPPAPDVTIAGGTVSRAGTPGDSVTPMAPVSPDGGVVTTSAPPAVITPPAGTGKLTDAQARAVVVIKGDVAEGTGFLVKTAAGPMVITNQHVIAANPHLQITTSAGQPVKFLGLQGAADRDLAMIPVQDNNYSYLELATDVGNTVQVGDQVITPGNSEGGGVLLNTNGVVLALGPQKVEISNPIYHGNSGGPVFHVKSGKVIGVVTEAMKVDTDNTLDKASHDNQNSAISGEMRYFGLRLDTVAQWDNYTWARFENETEFLSEFHERSKCLDSYLNTGMNDQSEWGLYYLKDDKIKEANQEVGDMANGGDASERVEAERNLIFNLDAVADIGMVQVQQPTNFYSYDQQRARDETGYRQALKKEIDNMSTDVSRIGSLARRNN
jgi:S1-C subfamily serine protease